MICPICVKNDTHRYACGDCIATTHRRLRELYAKWLATPTMLDPTRGTTGRRSPGYGSRPPARDDVLVMLDHRTHAEQLSPDDEDTALWSLLGTLHGLAQFVPGHAGQLSPRHVTMSGEVGYLLGRLAWCATQQWVADIAENVLHLHNQARAIVNDDPPAHSALVERKGARGGVPRASTRSGRQPRRWCTV